MGRRSDASQPKGVVAAGHPVTAEAGAEILRAGGNAVDAAVCAVCTSFVAEPVLTGAGGGGFLLMRQADGKTLSYDGFARMPGKPVADVDKPEFQAIPIDFGDTVQTFHIGRAAVATPPLLAMLFQAWREHGRLPLTEVLQPALQAARDGVMLNALQASFIRLLEPILTYEAGCRALHAPGGELLAEGDPFRNPDLANLLELLAIEGVEEMYKGDVARAIVAACQPGGLLEMDDLARSRGTIRKPLAVDIFGGRLVTNPPPSSGGCLIAFCLILVERVRARTPGMALNAVLAECLHTTSTARAAYFDKRAHQPGIETGFLSDARLNDAMHQALSRLKDGAGKSPEPSSRLGSTTHISILDADNLAVAITTSNGEGSGIVAPGTGIHLNNMLGEEDINPGGFHRLPPGETLPSMMAPTIFVRQGKPAVIMGSGGSNRLRGAIVQVLCRHLLAGEDIETAVHAPRLHNEDHVLDVEPDCLSEAEAVHLAELGWSIRRWRQPSVYFGGVHAISMDERGAPAAAGDPRRGGAVAWA